MAPLRRPRRRAITLARFQQLVAAETIHFYVASGGGGGRNAGGNNAITSWVTSHFSSTRVGSTMVYDLTDPS